MQESTKSPQERAKFASRLADNGRIVTALANLTERSSPETYYESEQDLAVIKKEMAIICDLVGGSADALRREKIVSGTANLPDIKSFLQESFDDLLKASSRRAAMRQQLADRKGGLDVALLRFERVQKELDNRVGTSAAAALIWMKVTPQRLNPIIQNVMKGIKVSYHRAEVRP